MNPFSILLILFIGVPVLEIYVLIKVGGVIGAGWTVALVVLTAVLGAALLRQQGMSALARARASMDAGQVPALELIEGALLVLGGALLLTPGFVTDAVGFVCLLPPTRQALVHLIVRRLNTLSAGKPPQPHHRTIEGDFRHDD